MKHAGKIFMLLLLVAALFLLFYPDNKRPELNGTWRVKQVIVDGQEQDAQRYLTIEGNTFDADITRVRKRLRKDIPEYRIKIAGHDSLTILSKKPPALYDGHYKIYYTSKIIGGAKVLIMI